MTLGSTSVILFSAKQPAMAPLWVGLAVFGSTAGNIVLFYLSRKGGRRYLKRKLSGISPAIRMVQSLGLVRLFIPALIPYSDAQ